MPRFKIQIQYDGTGFRGWQLQKKERTIQGEIEAALKIINEGERIVGPLGNIIVIPTIQKNVDNTVEKVYYDKNTNKYK